ncbi:MAG TPA: hypothetical protein VFB66_04895 [Tepidisphaeraceae bacterium]|nr:hypothetical protein [Tepidisphaeraceae bacterium]
MTGTVLVASMVTSKPTAAVPGPSPSSMLALEIRSRGGPALNTRAYTSYSLPPTTGIATGRCHATTKSPSASTATAGALPKVVLTAASGPRGRSRLS